MNAFRWLLRPPYAIPAAVYAAVCMAMWPLPLLGLLHVSSSAVVAGVAFFVAGLSALALFGRQEPLGLVLGRHVALLLVPAFLLTVSLLWRPNCGYLQGLLLFGTFAVPSVGLAVALAYALDASGPKRRKGWFVLIAVLVATLPVVYDLRFHPQLYTYNHVWGGVLGTLYDEELVIRPGLFFFRGLTVWWSVALVLIAQRAHLRRSGTGGASSRRTGLGLLAVALVIAGTYAAAPWLGINSPSWYIQQRLGGHLQLERFDIYYDPEAITAGQLRVIADVHEYRYQQLSDRLDVDVPRRITTYIYPDVATKAALLGSRIGGVVPTWLPAPQVHIRQDRFGEIFTHELAHAMAREFGMPVIRASPAVGLVEGLAVALEPPDGRPSLHAQVAAALHHREDLGIFGESVETAIARQLRPFGFWTGRGAVSYTTMGSFVRYLLDTYGPEPLQAAYRTGRVAEAFGRPVLELARDWERFVRDHPEDPEAVALVMARFSRPSLFERRCPHYLPPATRHLRRGRAALAAGEVRRAQKALDAAVRADGSSQAALSAWAGLQLALGNIEDVRRNLGSVVAQVDTLAGVPLLTRLGDTHRLAGDDARADSAYALALERLPAFARQQRALLELRSELPAETLHLLIQPLPAAQRAEALEEAPSGSAPAALLWAEAARFERAADVMQRAAGQLPRAERLAWQAAFAHAAGDRLMAAILADASAAAYRSAGATAAAERQEDRAGLLWWHVDRQQEPHSPNVTR